MVLALVMAVLLLGIFGAVVRDHVQTAEAARQSAREGAVSPVAAISPEGDRVIDAQAAGPRIDSRHQAK